MGHEMSGEIIEIGPIGLATLFAIKGTMVVSEPALARRLLAQKSNGKIFDPTGKSVQECVTQLRKLSHLGLTILMIVLSFQTLSMLI